MGGVSLCWSAEKPIINRSNILQSFSLRLPLNVAVPQPIGSEFQTTSAECPFELRSHKVLVVGTSRSHVCQVVNPEVDGQRNGLQTSLENLHNHRLIECIKPKSMCIYLQRIDFQRWHTLQYLQKRQRNTHQIWCNPGKKLSYTMYLNDVWIYLKPSRIIRSNNISFPLHGVEKSLAAFLQ